MSTPGSRWWRFDLHNHSPASGDYRGDKSITPQDWLLDYMRAGIDAVAITDHNTAAWIDPLKSALAELGTSRPEGFRELTLFPGVEITAHDGLHLLAVFDPSATGHTVSALLGRLGCPERPDNHEAMCESGSLDILKSIHSANAIAIAAHVDQAKGLYEVAPGSNPPTLRLDNRTIGSLLSLLHALQVVDRSAAQLQPVLPALSQRIALIAASDAHKSAAAGRASTWIKCTTPTLQGLKLALLDHSLAVRVYDDNDPNRVPANWIRSLSINDFRERRRPLRVRFNSAFNALIGGRGTGKSTVIEATRLAVRRESDIRGLREDSEVRRALARFAQANLEKPGALCPTAKCVVEYERDGQCFRLTFDQEGRAPAVERQLEDGSFESVNGLTPADIAERWPIRVLSQKQVFELAGSPRALLNLIDGDPRLGKAEWQREFDDLARRFKALRADRRLVQQRIGALAVRKDELAQISRKLKAFEQSNVGDELQAYQHAIRQREVFEDRFMIADALTRALDENLRRASTIRDGRLHEFAPASPAESDAHERLQRLEERLRALPVNLHQVIVDAKREIEVIRQSLLQSEWKQQVDATIQGHADLVARMQAMGIDSPKAYGLLTIDRQRIERELLSLNSEQERTNALDEQIAAVRAALAAKRAELTEKRRAFIAKYIRPTSEALRQTLREMADVSSAEAAIREALSLEGNRFDRDIYNNEGSAPIGIVAELHRSGNISKRWAQACSELDDRKPVVLGVSLGSWLLTRLSEKVTPEQFDELLTRFPEDELILQYQQGDSYKTIDEGSAGQKSAAVLAFLLAFGDEPLIIDQPEDDLDNAMVYKLVVLGIRDNKARRQLIVATHNANIVVNGDAEYVIPMRYAGGGIDVDPSAGGMQETAVREKICEVMEGGRKAFEMRYKKILKDLR
jgi:energy-coupling factor transporter ATP-binding protein EcfA2